MSTLGDIPEPQASVESLLTTVKAMKQILEGTTGQRNDGRAPIHTIDLVAPLDPRVGDMWTRPSRRVEVTQDATYLTRVALGSVLSVWNGAEWVVVSVAGEYYERSKLANTSLGSTSFVTALTTSQFGAKNQIWYMEYLAVLTDSTGAALFRAIIADEANVVVSDEFLATAGTANFSDSLRASAIVQFTRPRVFNCRIRDQSFTTGTVGSVTTTPANSHTFRAIRLL